MTYANRKRLFSIIDKIATLFVLIYFIFDVVVAFAEGKDITVFSVTVHKISDVCYYILLAGLIASYGLGWFFRFKDMKKIGISKEEKKFRIYILSLANKAYHFSDGKKDTFNMKNINGWFGIGILVSLWTFGALRNYCEDEPFLIVLVITAVLVYAMLFAFSNYCIYEYKIDTLIEKRMK